MKKKFPEWWLQNRSIFALATEIRFVPKKIRKPLEILVNVLDAYLLYKGPLAPLADMGKGLETMLKDIEIVEE